MALEVSDEADTAARPAARTVRLPPEYETAPSVARIGIVIYDEDVTSEGDIKRLNGPENKAAAHIARMKLPLDSSPEGLARTAEDLSAAAAQLAPSAHLDALAFSCTTGALELGYERVAASMTRARPGIPVATPITGAIKAFAALGVARISLLTPYKEHLNTLIADHLRAAGVEVLNIAAFDVPNEVDFARVTPRALCAGALSAMHRRADALFISCTALRATPLIPDLEAALARPVVTSTQALWWEALRLAGAPTEAPRSGRLMQI